MNPSAILGIIVTLFEETQRLSALAQELQTKLDQCEAINGSTESVDG